MNGIKPPYYIPSMKEIAETPWNGYTVVSTFSGGGGSCLGYRMAGYKVLWANEFVEEAQRTYRANHPSTILNTKDIRTVTAQEILAEIGLSAGEIDLFDGSPPCCAFSTAGQREKGWNKDHLYSDGKSQQIENLFFEYIRLLKGLQPKTFVAENVSGLVKGTALGYFKEFLREMKNCGYNVKAKLLNAKWLGVPQSRERLIFVGVRNDIGIEPMHPKPLPYFYTLKEAFEGLPEEREEKDRLIAEYARYRNGSVLKMIPKNPPRAIKGSSIMNGSYFNLSRESFYQPCSTICQMNGQKGTAGNCHPIEDRKFTISELKRITSLPDDFILTGDYPQRWERAGRMVPPIMMKHIAQTIQKEVLDKCETT